MKLGPPLFLLFLACLGLDWFLRRSLPQLGLQAWTFRRFTLTETLDKASSLGIHYLEAYPGQTLGGDLTGKFNHQMDESTCRKVLEMARSKGVTLVSYGVVNAKDEAEWRQIFTFAKTMGLRNITSEPPQESLPVLDQLSREFHITIAIHNHPTPSRYADPQTALEALQPYGKNLGVCADTGHWARSGYNPSAALNLLRGRIIETHFKDLNQGIPTGKDVPWGTGTSNAAEQLAVLRQKDFGGVVLIEYENDTPHLEADVQRCVKYFNLAMKAPLADLMAGKVVPPEFTAGPLSRSI